MQPAFDNSTLERLVTLGRERGQLTTEDLRTTFAIDAMSAEDIALIVVHLEEAGVPVELEDSLLSAGSRPPSGVSAEIIPFPKRPSQKRPKPQTMLLKPAPTPLPEPRQPITQDTPVSHWIVATAGGLAFAIFTLIILAAAS